MVSFELKIVISASQGSGKQGAQSQGPLNLGYHTCSRQEPRATPSKNWWNVSAASSGRMVHGELLTPSAMPMSTEWKAMPVSSTCARAKSSDQHMCNHTVHTDITALCIGAQQCHVEPACRADLRLHTVDEHMVKR